MAISDTCDMHMVSVKIAKLCYWQESTRFESVKTGTYLLYKTIAKAKESGADGLIITKSGTRNVRVRDGMGGSHHYSLIYIESEAIIYLDK
jgi:hypothetical protein